MMWLLWSLTDIHDVRFHVLTMALEVAVMAIGCAVVLVAGMWFIRKVRPRKPHGGFPVQPRR